MLHWYFMLIVMGTPVQFGPFTEEKCDVISDKFFTIFEREIQAGLIKKIECWRVTGA